MPRTQSQLAVLTTELPCGMYILSHPEFEQGIKDRCEALLASIPRGETAPAQRVEQERPILRSTVYIQERDRLLCERGGSQPRHSVG